jgi:hypothetical protein
MGTRRAQLGRRRSHRSIARAFKPACQLRLRRRHRSRKQSPSKRFSLRGTEIGLEPLPLGVIDCRRVLSERDEAGGRCARRCGCRSKSSFWCCSDCSKGRKCGRRPVSSGASERASFECFVGGKAALSFLLLLAAIHPSIAASILIPASDPLSASALSHRICSVSLLRPPHTALHCHILQQLSTLLATPHSTHAHLITARTHA